jgi:hypothetical protein
VSQEKLQPLLDEIHGLGYTIDRIKWGDTPRDDAPALCKLLARMVALMIARVKHIDQFHERNKENLAYLEYISAMNYAIFAELGFSDKDLEDFASQSKDPKDVAIQRIRDLKGVKTTTLH